MEQDNNGISLVERYKLAINSRNKLTDDYHKWMTFYYIATSAFPVAIATLYKTDSKNLGILALAVVGIFLSTLWHLSCKGYYYWSKNWIRIIIRFEKILFKNDKYNGVYSVFFDDVKNNQNKIWIPTQSANISTPKLSLLFSFVSILCWIFFSCYYLIQLNIFCEKWISYMFIGLCILIYVLIYCFVLPKFTKSLSDKDSHILINDEI